MLEIKNIEEKYERILHLTANENVMSELAERYYISEIKNRYKMGKCIGDIFTSGNFAAKAMPEVERIIVRAEKDLQTMLNAECVTLNCLSGVHAMISSILSCTDPGDVIMSVESNHGGHFCTKGLLEMSGRKHVSSKYDYSEYTFDVEQIAEECRKKNVKAIYLDTSVVLKPHPIRQLRQALGKDVVIIYDASHTIGLIMSGVFQNPLEEGADVISANTHKTLPGPHHGLVAFRNKEFGNVAISKMTKSLYSSTHVNAILALGITIFEMKRWGKEYSKKIISNANMLGDALTSAGMSVRKVDQSHYTYTHQLHVYIEKENNKEITERFLKNNISINTSKALGDKLFIRFGLQEITRRGLNEENIGQLANIISRVSKGKDMTLEVADFLGKLGKIHYAYNVGEENEMWQWLNIHV